MAKNQAEIDWIVSHAKWSGDCLVYQGGNQTYPHAWDRRTKRSYPAHRLMYMLVHDIELTPDQFVCHSCDNPPCINPDHLWLGDAAANNRDRHIKGRTRPGDSSKLLPSHVVFIREHPKLDSAKLADLFNVTRTTITNVRSGRTFAEAGA